MGSEALLPVILFSDELKPGTTQWNSVRARVQQSLQEFGSFEALFTKLPSQIQKDMFGAIKELFELPLQTISEEFSSKTPFCGYTGKSPTGQWESIGIEDVVFPENINSFTSLLWPEGNPSFGKTFLYYSEQLSKLDQMTRKMVLEILGIEKHYDEHMDSSRYYFRVMKYEPSEIMESKLMLNAHADKNLLTILSQDQVGGLEVQSKDGQWITVKPSLDSFIVLLGDSFHAWTNGLMDTSIHRVVMTRTETRYSAGLFSSLKEGRIVKVPDELVDEEHPLRFKPFEFMEYVKFVKRQKEQKGETGIKVFCGV